MTLALAVAAASLAGLDLGPVLAGQFPEGLFPLCAMQRPGVEVHGHPVVAAPWVYLGWSFGFAATFEIVIRHAPAFAFAFQSKVCSWQH